LRGDNLGIPDDDDFSPVDYGVSFKKKHPVIWKRFSTTANPVVQFKVLGHKPYGRR